MGNSLREAFSNRISDRLRESRAMLAEQWRNPQGTPTRHFVLDGLLPEADRRAIYDAFPPDAAGFHRLDTFRERKKTSVDLEAYPPILAAITYAFQSGSVIGAISEICGLTGIEPDSLLYAGGISMMLKDDFLNPHLDNSHDAERRRYRRLNLLYYVSPDWQLENGGNFELWDAARRTPKTIICAANRLVVMETTRGGWHSVGKVQADRPRCCVSNYYFSRESPDGQSYYHVTSFAGRPEEKLKRVLSSADNALRNLVSKALRITTGKRRKAPIEIVLLFAAAASLAGVV